MEPEAYQNVPCEQQEKPLSFARRKELLGVAEEIVNLVNERKVTGRELCFLREATMMLTER